MSRKYSRYQQVLEQDEHNETALDALEHLFEKTERWFELLQIIGTEPSCWMTPTRSAL